MQDRSRSTLMRMGVRQRNKELCKWQSCASNKVKQVAPAGTGEVLLLFPTLQRIRKQSHWGRNSLEGSKRGAQKLQCCKAILFSSRFVTYFHYGEQTLLMDTMTDDCQYLSNKELPLSSWCVRQNPYRIGWAIAAWNLIALPSNKRRQFQYPHGSVLDIRNSTDQETIWA